MATNDEVLAAVQAAVFEFGFDEFRRAYDAAMGAERERGVGAEEIVRARWGLGAGEEPPAVTHDDEGAPSPDFWEDVWELDHESESNSVILRKAFASALFHFWEKHTNRWRNQRSYNHAAVMSLLVSRGYSPQEQVLKALELTANCLKHGPGRSCDECFALRPGLFAQGGVVPTVGFTPDDENLQVSNALMEEFLEAVKASGLRQGGPQP